MTHRPLTPSAGLAITAVFCLLAPVLVTRAASGQQAPPAKDATAQANDLSAENARQARAVLDAMVKALGGDAWLNMTNREYIGSVAAFYQGKPSGGTTPIWDYFAWPDHDRIEITKHRDYVQLYLGDKAWEIIYSGTKDLPKEQMEDYLRRRNHSIEMAVKVWLKDPKTMLFYEGQHLAGRHLADQVTLLSASNESITILTDAETHLPLKRSFEWRDPVYHDKNEDSEEYVNYHMMGGFPTPLNISRYRNGDMVSVRYINNALYNQQLPPDLFNLSAIAHKIVKK